MSQMKSSKKDTKAGSRQRKKPAQTPSGTQGATRRVWTDEEKVRIALERYASMGTGRAITNATLAERHGCDESQISKMIKSAFEKGLVEIRRVEKSLEPPSRDETLENELSTRHAQLTHAIVVDSDDGPSNGGPSNTRVDDAHWSDIVHERLGYAAADYISTGALLRPGDYFAVGSGRGAFFTVESLRQNFRKLRADNVTLMSLTGATYPQAHSHHLNVALDADFHVAFLGLCFEKAVTARYVSYPLVHDDVANFRKNTWLADGEFNNHLPNHALVGVGVVQGAHRFRTAVTRSIRGGERKMAPVLSALKTLVEICDENAKEGVPCPVGDVCNRLFVLESQDEVRPELQPLVDQVNSKLLTVSREQLERIENIILVAGSQAKAPAIRQLLEDERLSIRVVCTDSVTARSILHDTARRAETH